MIVRCWRLERTLKGVEGSYSLVARFTTEEEAHKSVPFLVGEGVGGSVFPETIEIFDSSKAWCSSENELFRLSGLEKLTDLEKQALGLVNLEPCGKCIYFCNLNRFEKDQSFLETSLSDGCRGECCFAYHKTPVVRKREDVVADCEHFGVS